MIEYIYFVKCPDCEDEHFDFFDEAKEYAMGCLSKKPIITQVEVCRNDFGECTDSTDLGTIWSSDYVIADVDKEPSDTPSLLTKDFLNKVGTEEDPEFAALDNSVDVEEPVAEPAGEPGETSETSEISALDEIPDNLDCQEHWTFKFLNALLNLYAGNYNEALLYINEVLEKHECQEALYLKSRALERMGMYNEADDVNTIIAEKFDMSIPDVKVLYMISILNELHIGDPGLDLMKRLVLTIPKYDRGIVSLRMLMKRNKLFLESSSNSDLIDAFNSDISDAEFSSFLQQCRTEVPASVTKLIDSIKKLVFE